MLQKEGPGSGGDGAFCVRRSWAWRRAAMACSNSVFDCCAEDFAGPPLRSRDPPDPLKLSQSAITLTAQGQSWQFTALPLFPFAITPTYLSLPLSHSHGVVIYSRHPLHLTFKNEVRYSYHPNLLILKPSLQRSKQSARMSDENMISRPRGQILRRLLHTASPNPLIPSIDMQTLHWHSWNCQRLKSANIQTHTPRIAHPCNLDHHQLGGKWGVAPWLVQDPGAISNFKWPPTLSCKDLALLSVCYHKAPHLA